VQVIKIISIAINPIKRYNFGIKFKGFKMRNVEKNPFGKEGWTPKRLGSLKGKT